MKPSDWTISDADALLAKLYTEFAQLNDAHFAGALAPPEIVLSRRKTYGGYYQPHRHRIVLSVQAYQEHGWDETSNTFRHEVAHIVHPNHSQAFWQLASKLGATRRHAASPRVSSPVVRRFIYACPACGRRLHRCRRLRLACSCGACDKRFNPAFALRLISS